MTEMTDSPETASGSAGETAKHKAEEAAGQAQEKAQQVAGQAKNRLAVQVDERSTRAGERLRATAGDVRSVGDELRKQGKEKPAQLADRAAGQVERLGGYLHESDTDRILRDVEDFGRRNPSAVVAGGLILGFVASRFLKASSNRRFQASSPGDAGRAGAAETSTEQRYARVSPGITAGRPPDAPGAPHPPVAPGARP